jgi:hypothetical protein
LQESILALTVCIREGLACASTVHESPADTTISTNGDYSAFVNQPKEFTLKLTLHEESKSTNHKSQHATAHEVSLNDTSFADV